MRVRLTEDFRFTLDGDAGTYQVQGDSLVLRLPGREVAYQFKLEKDELTLSGGDLAQPLKFVRQASISAFFRRLFEFSPEALKFKVYRILIILGIVALCRVALTLLRGVSRMIILSDRGPLRFVYRYRKNRALTLHSLGLNIAKYVIYFTAFGFILGEFGIPATAYLASLSVIGLAVGFGSQGLVQDTVTGFFVIFEAQFDVGDMVQISDQVGIVEELGLRMTKLRNYLGQTVFIPNRNLSVVGTFAAGAQHALVDVAAPGPEAAQQETRVLRVLGEEIKEQFKGAVLAEPEVIGPLSLRTGEHFVRMHLAIWPQQQWVVQEQLIPRIRALLKQQGFEIPGDRIAVSYHGREERSVQSWEHALKSFTSRIVRSSRQPPTGSGGA
jgi:small conductance mechanosensitive channel